MTDAFIYDAVRTPRGRGRPNGALHTLSPLDLCTATLGALRDRTHFDQGEVEDVVFGVGDAVDDQGAVISRSAALYLGLSDTIPGSQVARFCGSGLEAINIGAAKVMAGQAELVVAGGVEMMSLISMGGTGGPFGSDAWFNSQVGMAPQGIGADLIATLNGYSRADVDAYAVSSQQRAGRAWAEGRFSRSVVPVADVNGVTLLERDEHMRPDTTVEGLSGLKPAFEAMGNKLGFDDIVRQRYPQVDRVRHVHHAGNSSGIVDGAAAVLVGTAEAGRALGLKPRARIRSFASVGSEPTIMLIAPPAATARALKRAGMAVSDIDLFEVNEAFASVALFFMQESGAPHEKVNVNGGAIALGHPVGATGVMLMGTLVDELERSGAGTGVVIVSGVS
jgi:acetyl-CoA C-acetyltransferase